MLCKVTLTLTVKHGQASKEIYVFMLKVSEGLSETLKEKHEFKKNKSKIRIQKTPCR